MEYPREHLEKFTSRPRSERPLVNGYWMFSIAALKEWGLLAGRGAKRESPEFFVTTKIAAGRGKCTVRLRKNVHVIKLESKPSVCGPNWYFIDVDSGKRVKSLLLFGSQAISRETWGAVYASQYQSKAYRTILKLEKLTLAIEGSEAKGPSRGRSRLKKLALLRHFYSSLRADPKGRQKAIDTFPQFKKIVRGAGGLLRREIPKLPKGWDRFDE